MIETVGLTKRFGSLEAVKGLTLHVGRGEVLALLGPNGAGKTTTVRMLSAILRPTEGKAWVAGYEVTEDSRAVRQRVGVLTEAPGLYTRMTGLEYLKFFGSMWSLDPAILNARIAELADAFGMSDALNRRLGTYSKGMRQKIALMRAMVHDPPVLLLDEPTSALDPQNARLVRDAILRLRSESARAIVVCTHNLAEAEELCDRLAVIRQGRLVALGTPVELKAQVLGPPLMEIRYVETLQDDLRGFVGRFAEVVAAGQGWVRYRTDDPEHSNPALLKALVSQGVSVHTLTEVPQTLEAAYLKLMQDGADAA